MFKIALTENIVVEKLYLLLNIRAFIYLFCCLCKVNLRCVIDASLLQRHSSIMKSIDSPCFAEQYGYMRTRHVLATDQSELRFVTGIQHSKII